jgi:carboxymethylenebutenolidase
MNNERKNATDFPQELLNFFDLYVHGDITRRTFLNHARKFAVGGITLAALWQSLKPNYAWAMQIQKDDKRIKTEDIVVQSSLGNGQIKGYLARPAKPGQYPGVLVIHENRGLNPYIQDVARRLAVEGYTALAPDGLTSVGGYPGDDEKGGELFKKVDPEKMTADFMAAANWLKDRSDSNGKLGIVGFCFGGTLTYTLATRLGGDLQAAVPFYGAQPTTAETAKIRAPLLIHDGGLDKRTLDGWPAFEKALKAYDVKYTHDVYKNANHGFYNDTTPRYDEKAAKLAWKRTLEFFKKYLS